jgi:hypothetical protein
LVGPRSTKTFVVLVNPKGFYQNLFFRPCAQCRWGCLIFKFISLFSKSLFKAFYLSPAVASILYCPVTVLPLICHQCLSSEAAIASCRPLLSAAVCPCLSSCLPPLLVSCSHHRLSTVALHHLSASRCYQTIASHCSRRLFLSAAIALSYG